MNRRKYRRVRAPKGTWVGWKSTGKTNTSRVENMGLGGLFVRTDNPLSTGSMLELVFDLPTGEVRARAIVRRSTPAKGMGIQFIQMLPEDRARLNRYLMREETLQDVLYGPARIEPRPANSYLVLAPRTEESDRLEFEKEVQQLVRLTGKGTYYQFLGVTSECSRSELKRRYYDLARKFHPDRHAGASEFMGRLKELMTVTTEAYRTLESEQRRAEYDKSLATLGAFKLGQQKTEAAESIDDWLKRANECLRAQNFVGSIVWLRKCCEAEPQSASYHAMLARSLGSLPRYQNESVEHFERAIDLDPWQEAVYLQFAELLERMHLASRESAIYSRLLEINPMNAKAR
ncbi:MAG: DnaJ domain-containing protein, partial [Terracidiphilus sp.]